MPERRVLLTLLAVWSLVTDAIAVSGAGESYLEPQFEEAFRAAIFLSQVGLLATWAGVSRLMMVWRMLLLAAGICLAAVLGQFAQEQKWSTPGFVHHTVVFAVLASLTAIMFSLSQLSGYGLIRRDSHIRRLWRWHFSLGELLALATAFALLLGLRRLVDFRKLTPAIGDLGGSWGKWVPACALFGGFCVLSVWAILGRRNRPRVGDPGSGGPAPLAAVCCLIATKRPSPTRRNESIATILMMSMGLLAGPLFVMRAAGYRWTHLPRPEPARPNPRQSESRSVRAARLAQ